MIALSPTRKIMKHFVETERLILREIVSSDAEAMFEMDSNVEVHKYLGNKPFKTITDSEDNIRFIRQQYVDNGIGRWAVVTKAGNQFAGWSGLKLITTQLNNHVNFYEIGYRFLPQFWGKGFATESALATIAYGFEVLKLDAIYAIAHRDNVASRHTLQKCGLRITGQFDYDDNIVCDWFELIKSDWKK